MMKLVADLRDRYVFHDFASVEQLVHDRPEVIWALLDAVGAVEATFGFGPAIWLVASEDWEGVPNLTIMVEFGGSAEQASALCRQFTREWLVMQDESIRKLVTIDVRFV